MFQYAFLRTMANRLGVRFHCPQWIGDAIFDLHDGDERAAFPADIRHVYHEPWKNFGYCERAMHIRDCTELFGYFQSERYYSATERQSIRKWFTFRPSAVAHARARFASADFGKATAIHVRCGDYRGNRIHVSPTIEYYAEAISIVSQREHLLVFSDDIALARTFLQPLASASMRFMEGTTDIEDLFLMSRCADHICAASSFSWWGAWLSGDEGVTCAPKEWTQYGSGFSPVSIPCEHWHTLAATRSHMLDTIRSFWAGARTRAKRLVKRLFGIDVLFPKRTLR